MSVPVYEMESLLEMLMCVWGGGWAAQVGVYNWVGIDSEFT